MNGSMLTSAKELARASDRSFPRWFLPIRNASKLGLYKKPGFETR
ncbi:MULTISPECIES: hypothetical protein [Cyanophyceae]|nr:MULTISPECIES: hypothetical protein [unclassified Trichocoleus]